MPRHVDLPLNSGPDLRPSPKQKLPIDRSIGQALRNQRMAANFTQQALADRCGLSFQQIQKYESGKNRIAASRLVQFASVLNVPVGAFFTDGKERARPEAETQLTDRLLTAALRLDDEPLAHLVGIAEQIAGRSDILSPVTHP
ncbi:MAG: helix-turn-helix domain-containing protein [Parvularcula sp.]